MNNAKRVIAATGLTEPEAVLVLRELAVGDVKAACSLIDLAQFFDRDPVQFARDVRRMVDDT